MTLAPSPLRIALFEPRIPPNTGNIARSCAAFQLPLSLIEPLGFSIDDRSLKRAGLDYWPHVEVTTHGDFERFVADLPDPHRLIGCSRHQGESLSNFQFQPGDVLLFGREDTGLPTAVRHRCDAICTIPMRGHEHVRSLNLSVSCALVSFQAGLQLGLW
ncbi:MAG: tRNA (cytidine(34)-2'-O)-methyltransferase [Synechococcus sp.]